YWTYNDWNGISCHGRNDAGTCCANMNCGSAAEWAACGGSRACLDPCDPYYSEGGCYEGGGCPPPTCGCKTPTTSCRPCVKGSSCGGYGCCGASYGQCASWCCP